MTDQVKKFVDEICELLNVGVPEIVEDASTFPTSTMFAAYCVGKEENTIYVKPTEKPTVDLFFSIAHELRHKWQYEKRKGIFFEEYHQVTECKDVEEYNNQLAEIDANAFGAIIMANYFGLEPLFSSLSERTKQRIKERIEEITDNSEVVR